MSKTRKFITITAPVVLGSLALAGCGGSSEGESGSDPLKVWIMGDTGQDFQSLVEPFTEDTGIKVEVEAIPWANVNDKITTATASGKGPDVMQIGLSILPTLAEAENLLPLEEYYADYPALAPDNFADAVAGDATAIEGQTLSIPWVADTRVLFYRTDILEDVGISDAPTTWDELHAAAAAAAERPGGKYGYYIPQWDSSLPVAWTWSAGGEVINSDGAVDLDTDAFRSAADFYISLYKDGLVPTDADFDQVQGFVNGDTPLMVSGPYLGKSIADAAPELDGKWAAALLPAKEDSISLFAGSNLGIWHNTKNVDSSLELLSYLADEEVQVEWFKKVNELPANKAAMSDPELTSDPNVAIYLKQLESSKVTPMVPNWDSAVGNEVLDALNSIVLQDADKEQTLKALYEAVSSNSVL